MFPEHQLWVPLDPKNERACRTLNRLDNAVRSVTIVAFDRVKSDSRHTACRLTSSCGTLQDIAVRTLATDLITSLLDQRSRAKCRPDDERRKRAELHL